MPKLEAKYVPIGTKIEENKFDTGGKTLKELEQEAVEKNKRVGVLGANNQQSNEIKPLIGKEEPKIKPLVAIKKEEVKPLISIEDEKVEALVDVQDEKIEPLIDIAEEVPQLPDLEALENQEEQAQEVFDNSVYDEFIQSLSVVEKEVNHGIKSGDIVLIVTNADQNMHNIKNIFDDAVADVVTSKSINYDIRDEKKVEYSQVLSQAMNKLEKLEQTIDHEQYQNELKVSEMEDSMLRQNRYRKKKLEGLDDIGGIEGKSHKTDEKQEQIDVKRNTDFDEGGSRNDFSSGASSERRGREGGYVERRAFTQDYEGSDLDNAGSSRDKLEAEILKKQEAEDKKAKKKKKTEEEKIEAAKERLRKKQEKRKAKQQKKTKASDVEEIDLVGNQFDVDELREEKMDRLLEIKKLSAEKKEMQKQKEKQRTKATKEFYKYKKVNKKSHIVGFKQ